MTTLAAPRPGAVPSRARAAVRPVTFGRTVAAEWVKFRTLRSTWWTLGVGAVLMIAFSVLTTWAITTIDDEGGFPGMSGASFATSGYFFAQLAFCVLGVLIVTGEYSTGMVRSTFAAVPRRLPVLWAKLVVVFTAVLAVSLVATAISWAVGSLWYDDLGLSIDLGRSEDLRILLGTSLYLATATALAYAFGALVRHSAAGLAIVFGLLLVVENAFAAIPWRPIEVISPFMPATAGQRLLTQDSVLAMMDQGADVATLSPWQGYGVMAAWVVVLLAVAAVLLRRRDA